MQEIEKLQEFNVQKLLEGALRKLESANLGGLHGQVVESARNEVAAVLAAQLKGGEELQHNVERTLRQTAKRLMSMSDLDVESAIGYHECCRYVASGMKLGTLKVITRPAKRMTNTTLAKPMSLWPATPHRSKDPPL